MFLKTNVIATFTVGCFFFAVACNTHKQAVIADKPNQNAVFNEQANPACELDLIVEIPDDFSNANLHIESVSYEAPCLVISYNYSGCKQAEAKVLWNGRLTRSYPPAAFLELFLSETGDCDQLHSATLRVDLKTLQKIAGKKFVVQLNHFTNSTTVSVID